MIRNISFLILMNITFLTSCNKVANEVNERDGKINVICLKDIDTIYIKVSNHTDSPIYVPKEYEGDYTNNDDTLHLETHSKPDYNTTYYYHYKNIFPFDFYTTVKISGYVADTIEQYKRQTYFYNQFRVQPIQEIKPDSSFIATLVFNTPKYAKVAKAVFYKKPFLTEARLKNIDYTLEDYILFDSLNANYVTTQIIMRYR